MFNNRPMQKMWYYSWKDYLIVPHCEAERGQRNFLCLSVNLIPWKISQRFHLGKRKVTKKLDCHVKIQNVYHYTVYTCNRLIWGHNAFYFFMLQRFLQWFVLLVEWVKIDVWWPLAAPWLCHCNWCGYICLKTKNIQYSNSSVMGHTGIELVLLWVLYAVPISFLNITSLTKKVPTLRTIFYYSDDFVNRVQILCIGKNSNLSTDKLTNEWPTVNEWKKENQQQ